MARMTGRISPPVHSVDQFRVYVFDGCRAAATGLAIAHSPADVEGVTYKTRAWLCLAVHEGRGLFVPLGSSPGLRRHELNHAARVGGGAERFWREGSFFVLPHSRIVMDLDGLEAARRLPGVFDRCGDEDARFVLPWGVPADMVAEARADLLEALGVRSETDDEPTTDSGR